MPSTNLIAAANAQYTEEVFLFLLEISSAALPEPLRFANNLEDVVSNGNTYVGFPFDITYFNEDDRTPRTQLRIQNVDRRISDVILAAKIRPSVNLHVVLASDPDTLEFSWRNFELTKVAVTSIAVQGDVVARDYSREPYPYRRAFRSAFPGLDLR